MFVLNMKLKPSKRAVVIGAMMSGLVAIICVAAMVCSQNAPAESATCEKVGTYSLKAGTKAEQVNFLKGFGLIADEIANEGEVTIPEIFNEEYEEYNGLQKEIGLDLARQKGKTAQKVTYSLKNSDERATLLIVDGMAVGGHLSTGEYGAENKSLLG